MKIYILLCLVLLQIILLTNGFKLSRTSEIDIYDESVETKSTEKDIYDESVEKKSGMVKKCDPCPKKIKCVPQIQCPAHVRMKSNEKPQICDLPAGKYGFCCVTGQNHTVKNYKGRSLGLHILRESIIDLARAKFANLLSHSTRVVVRRGHPDFMHHFVFHSTPQDNAINFQISNSAVEQVITSQMYQKKENIPIEDFETNSVDVQFDTSPLGHHCPAQPSCNNLKSKYRSADGTCNNPIPFRSLWGAAGQPMERLLPPAYEDGIWLPRFHGVDGSPLLAARESSRILFPDINRPHAKYNLFVMQFGQFIAHDVSQSSAITLENGEPIECCTPDGSDILPPKQRHYACLPIEISPNDEFYKVFKQRCLNMVRLSLSPSSNCKMGYGRQRSKVTHYLDGSPIYGSSQSTANDLRLFRGGRLKMLNDFGRDLLPLSNDKDSCASTGSGNTCFKSGDGRTNQIISLVVVHILFAREHNRIADSLAQINPHWPDEILYQESRKIVVAQLQHIVYNEYLPAVIGEHHVRRFDLQTKHHGYANDYDHDKNAAITNEFTGAAFRFGHSTVDGKFHLHKNNFIDEVIDIPDVMFNPSRIRKRDFLDDLTKTLVTQPMQRVDDSISHGLSRFLFRGENPFGLDLAAINIQRGRETGLRSYNDYLEVIGHRRIHSFNQFHPDIAARLSKVYKHPDDIDLWVGGLLENSVEGGVVGRTFAEIIGDQFSRFRHGDRYFYENDDSINPGFFLPEQLDEIRKSSWARIICDNIDHFTTNKVPPSAFVRADFRGNEPVNCNSHHIPSVNLDAWRE